MTELDSKQQYELKKFVKRLESIRARHTELVSVYIPKDYNIHKITQHLEEERGTASNIKSKQTKTNVIDALEKMIRHLQLFKKTPENGIAVFSGNISQNEGKPDIKVFSIEPSQPINSRLYRCDQIFVLDILKEQLEHKESYGLIVLDKRESHLGLLKGTSIIPSTKLTSGVPGKYKTGGQCQCPESLVEINKSQTQIKNIKPGDLLKSYDFKNKRFIFSKCLDKWKIKKDSTIKITTENGFINECSKDHLIFTKDNKEKPAESLTKGDYLLTYKNFKIVPSKIHKIEITSKPTEMIDISVKNHNFIANGIIVHNSAQRFARLREEAAHDFYKRVAEAAQKEFFDKKDLKGIIIGGPGPTKEEFLDGDFLLTELKNKVLGLKDITYTDEFGLQELVEKSKDLLAEQALTKEKELLTRFFEMLGKQTKKTAYGIEKVKKALEYGAVEILLISEGTDESISSELEELAINTGATTEYVSLESQEGEQFKNLSGIGAILRFEL